MEPALARVEALQATSARRRARNVAPRGSGARNRRSANMFADAFREADPGTDAAIGYAVRRPAVFAPTCQPVP